MLLNGPDSMYSYILGNNRHARYVEAAKTNSTPELMTISHLVNLDVNSKPSPGNIPEATQWCRACTIAFKGRVVTLVRLLLTAGTEICYIDSQDDKMNQKYTDIMYVAK